MAITRLKNIYSSKTGRILYVSPDDFDASDAISNRGNSPLRPFKSLQRALLEAARYSYIPGNGGSNDRFDQFTIMLQPGEYIIDNRPGFADPSNITPLTDNSNFDVTDPNNDLYKYNSTRGGVIVPRGTSIVGIDLRKTKIIPKFVPNPLNIDTGTLKSNYPTTGTLNSGTHIVEDDSRSAIFRVTGGCYFWQFSFFDGHKDGVYTGSPTPTGVTPSLVPFTFSHHKLTNFEFACFYDLSLYYQKTTRAFSDVGIPITDPLGQRIEENRIVGPGGIQADTVRISSITYSSTVATANTVNIVDGVTRYAHGFSIGSQIRVYNSDDAVTGITYNGTYLIVNVSSSQNDGIIDQFSYILNGVPNANATPLAGSPYLFCEVESDTVDSSSPYIFNVSIRSSYGVCGTHANGAMASGFKSMVIAQYTGICLQKDDRAFVRICGGTGSTGPLYQPNYQDGTIETCQSTILKPAHQDPNSDYKKGWRNYHLKTSNDGYIQSVSVFAVGFADQFLNESGGDMSVSNSESDFGNTALRSKGFKKTAFVKDTFGYVTHIIPPRNIPTSEKTVNWLSIDVQKTRNGNGQKIYLYNETNLSVPPQNKVFGYTVGAKSGETIFVGLGTTIGSATVVPSGPSVKDVAVGQSGNPILWDSGVSNWYIAVASNSSIVSTLNTQEFQSTVSTPPIFFTRVSDTRVPSDKLYRLRLVVPKTNPLAAPPQTGFVIQPWGGNSNYDNTYYIFDIETYQELITGIQDGIYYLTILLGNITPSADNYSDTQFSQDITKLYPDPDIDEPLSDPIAAKSIADNKLIGHVYTTNGTASRLDRSISKEAIIKWCKEVNNQYTVSDNSISYNYWDTQYTINVNGNLLTSKTGISEDRKIDLNDVNIELRRPSIIRSGNHKFEYTGFGPGNYSTGFPNKQKITLTDKHIALSQSKLENGGVVIYSGLNSNGDLYVGSMIINSVSGKMSNSTTDKNNISTFDDVIINNTLTVLGGFGNTSLTSFYGPVSVSGEFNLNSNFEITPTWSNPSVKQTAIKLNVNDKSSTANSNLIDLQVAGMSKFTIDKSGTVGVGNSLNVTNNLNVTGNIVTSNVNVSGSINVTNDISVSGSILGKILVSSGSSTAPSISFIGNSKAGIYSPGTNSLAIATNNNERIRITSSGNVGIGTTNPTQSLHIAGNARLTGQLYDSNNSAGTFYQVLLSTGTGTSWVTYLPNFQIVTQNINMIPGWTYAIAATNSVTLTLPSPAVAGYKITILNNTRISHTISRNGATIMGLAEDMIVGEPGIEFQIWYDGTTWRLF